MFVSPLGKRVLVKAHKVEKKQGILIVPNTDEMPLYRVLSITSAEKICVDDIVLITGYSGVKVMHNGESCLLVEEKDIVAVITED